MILTPAEMRQIVDAVKQSRRPSPFQSAMLDALAKIHPHAVPGKSLAHTIGSSQKAVCVLKLKLNRRIEGTGLRVASRTNSGYWLEYAP